MTVSRRRGGPEGGAHVNRQRLLLHTRLCGVGGRRRLSRTDGGRLQLGVFVRGRPHDRARAATQDPASPRRACPRRGGDRQRRPDLPLLRNQPSDLLRVAKPLRGARRGGTQGHPRGRPTPRTRPTRTWSARSLSDDCRFGPLKIAMYLRRYHDISISDSGVRRILKRLGVNQLPASQRHRRHDQRWKR